MQPELERRESEDRREAADRRIGRDRRASQDRLLARALPDEFAQAGGDADDRITSLVNRHWMDRDPGDRAELAKVLLPILEEVLVPGTPVTDHRREQCENVVVQWLGAAHLD